MRKRRAVKRDVLPDPIFHSKVVTKLVNQIMVDGKREWVTYSTLYVDGEDFNEIGEAFEKVMTVHKINLGNAQLRFMKQRELVDFAICWIEQYRK